MRFIGLVAKEYLGFSAAIGSFGLVLLGMSIWLPIAVYFGDDNFFAAITLALIFWPGLIYILIMELAENKIDNNNDK